MNRFIDSPPEGSAGWERVWRDDLRYPPDQSSSLIHRIVRAFVSPLVRRASRAEQERQRNFNVALLEMFRDSRAEVSALHRDLAVVHEDLLKEIRSIQQLLPIAVQRNDALVAAVDQKLESVASRLRDLSTPFLSHTPGAPARTDFIYRRLEEALRGSEAEVRAALVPYVERASAHQPVVDVGCGRGEFLELCRERSIDIKGFDTNERSVADLKSRGFDAELLAVPQCLQGMVAGSMGSILASHVVEHLASEVLTDFFAESARVLRRGGLLMIETPNAESLKMAASDFWRDPTHISPRHVGALALLAREFSFAIEDAGTTAPYPEGSRLEASAAASPDLRDVVQKLNAMFFGDQNLRLILRKEG